MYNRTVAFINSMFLWFLVQNLHKIKSVKIPALMQEGFTRPHPPAEVLLVASGGRVWSLEGCPCLFNPLPQCSLGLRLRSVL